MKNKMTIRPLIGWDIFDFSKTADRIQRDLTGSKIPTSSIKFAFFGPIGKTRWPPRPLIGRNIFNFSSETADQNSTRLDRKQDLNVLYQVCVFRADQKNKMTVQPLFGWYIFDFSSETAERNLTGSKISTSSTKFVFFGPIGKRDGRPASGFPRPLKPLNGIQRDLTGSKISTPSTKFMLFRSIGKTRWPLWPIRQESGTLFSGARYVALWSPCLTMFPNRKLHPSTMLLRYSLYKKITLWYSV